jgi:D-alanyl-D-alanine carboxypeptidase (penicillin-binding protein 5/6)
MSTAGYDEKTWRRHVLGLALLTCLVGTIYAFVTPAGLPYDEPSHWATVRYYADHGRMPVLGDDLVTYEAQMGPIAYVLDAGIVRAADIVGLGDETAFRLVRLFGVLQLAALVVVAGALITRFISRSLILVGALAVIALNPMLLTMSASVQNDSLALLLGVSVLLLALALLRDRPRTALTLGLGALAGFAVLTKLTNWVVVAVVAGWLAWVHGRRAVAPVAAFLGGTLAVSGWWFARNVVLYGDPTAASAAERTGVAFDRYRLTRVDDVGHVVQQVVTYLWLPTEYLRNSIGAPTVLKAALVAITVVAAVLGVLRLGKVDRSGLPLIVGTACLSSATWLVTYLGYQAVAPRVAYLALPFWLCHFALAASRLPQRAGVATVAVLVAGLNIWTIVELAQLNPPEYISL